MTRSLQILCKTGAVAVLAAASSLAVAQSGRLSLADRVAVLEQRSSDNQANVELLNRITQLQAEVQTLRGLLEEQDYKLQEMQRLQRDQAIDFDQRIARLEGGGASSGASAGSFMDAPVEPPATPSAPAGASDMSAPASAGIVDSVLDRPASSGASDAVSSTGGSQVSDPAAERAAYDSAFDALKNGQYAEAARRFQGFLAQYPNGDYAPNAQYWLGESYYVTQNYQIALDSFERLLAQFPASNKAPDALLKVGYCHYELRNWAQAEDALNRAMRQYPDTTVARLAQGRLRALRLEQR
jgi:tol-pal system protein YbgF